MRMCLNFIDFDLPKCMFKFINAEMTPKKRKRSERAIVLELFDLVYHVCCVFDKKWTFLKYKLMFAYDIT